MSTLAAFRKALRVVATPERAKTNAWFFKTGKGQYGEGDMFLGVTVPQLRAIVSAHAELPLKDVERLIYSKIHEERLGGFLLLVLRYQRGGDADKKKIFDFYLANAERANNWDLVDSSAHLIVGAHLLRRSKAANAPPAVLSSLAKSKNLWRRRVAIVSTLAFIREGRLEGTFRIADLLMKDRHDLVHKATGWMLREAGKKDRTALVAFLRTRYILMPRTMLRYAIERFPERERRAYIRGTV